MTTWIIDSVVRVTEIVTYHASVIPKSRPVEESSVWASWYLTPQQHLIEFITYGSIFPIAIMLLFYRLPRDITRTSTTESKSIIGSVSNKTVLLLFASFAHMVQDKYQRNTLWFLLQPCHMSCISLCALLLSPRTWKYRNLLFNVYLHLQWGAVVALLNPDLRGYTQFSDMFNFFFEHLLILLVPFYHLLITKEFTLMSATPSLCLFSFSILALYHSIVLEVACLFTGHNLNYMYYPPPGPLAKFGTFYRPVMFMMCIAFTFIMRYGIVTGLVRVLHRLLRKEMSAGKRKENIGIQEATSDLILKTTLTTRIGKSTKYALDNRSDILKTVVTPVVAVR